MDANDTDQANLDFQKFHRQCDLVDVFVHLHPGVTPPHPYQRRENRIDYIFIIPVLIPVLQSTGYLPFNILFTSDHGSTHANFDAEILMMGNMYDPVDAAQQNLVSGNPKGGENYCDSLQEQFTKHNIITKVNQLYNKIKNGQYVLHEVIEQYEALDKQITEIMLSAERTCQTSKTGKAWSLKLVQAVRQVRYWKTRKSDLLNNQEPLQIQLQLGVDLNIDYVNLSAEVLMFNIAKARKKLHRVQKQVAELRDEMLEEMVRDRITHENSDIATIIKNICHREKVKSTFWLMQPIAKGETGGAVSYIKGPIPIESPSIYPETLFNLGFKPEYKEIHDGDEIMTKLLLRNKLHLNQAWDILFTQGPLKDYIREYRLGTGCQDMLDGLTNVDISLENYKSLLKVQNESTSSSPSGWHYGHYKAVIDHDNLCLVHARMMSIPWLAGFTPTRWERAIDCMLEKDPVNPMIDRLWLIVIVEADMNATLKIIWNHRLVLTTEKTNCLLQPNDSGINSSAPTGSGTP
eukprot:15366999-Ditylum_brightwellii.AAC.1